MVVKPVNGIMGRAAVWLTTSALGAVGVAQLFGVTVSKAIEEFGPSAVDTMWSLGLIAGGVFVSAAMIAARTDEEAAVVLERSGVLCTVVGLGVYLAAIVAANGTNGNIMVIALAAAAMLNMVARQAFLMARERTVMRVCGEGE